MRFDYDIDPRSIDFLLFCTQTPDYPLPTTACLLQSRLGLKTSVGVTITATLLKTLVANDSYCLYATFPSKTNATYWLTSDDDTPVRTKPAVCP